MTRNFQILFCENLVYFYWSSTHSISLTGFHSASGNYFTTVTLYIDGEAVASWGKDSSDNEWSGTIYSTTVE